ncbi:hypothetical protein ANO11243_062160 [Dothideomycetidae sp. 11243]|nr:hypothetical protein ANO11243_062160 [fungal sp. No.11243]
MPQALTAPISHDLRIAGSVTASQRDEDRARTAALEMSTLGVSPVDISLAQHDTSDIGDTNEPAVEETGSFNRHTRGTEFYGKTGVFPFLARLRQRAKSFSATRPESDSIVSYMHNSDFAASPSQLSPVSLGLPSGSKTRHELQAKANDKATAHRLEAECARLYFSNLHVLHPVLDEDEFLRRCRRDIWIDQSAGGPIVGTGDFMCLYYAVLALGAIVAPADALNGLITADKLATCRPSPTLYQAKHFFEQSKAALPDIFEVSSLATTQTLFLLSVFCQNALKPHSCHLYSGMAARTALAIGLPEMQDDDNDGEATYGGRSRLRAAALSTWWCIYAHEVEMCCASGRDTFPKPPSHEVVSAGRGELVGGSDGGTHHAFMVACVSLANVLKAASEELYNNDTLTLGEQADAAARLNELLDKWKDDLPPIFQFDKTSLTEPDTISKQKVVLKLRFFSARILLFRRFIEGRNMVGASKFQAEIHNCLESARLTIQLLYETYLHRPYFRTYWYNTTYLLNAVMIALFLVLSGVPDILENDVLDDVSKAREVLGAMENSVVARQGARLVQEAQEAARQMIGQRQRRSDGQNSTVAVSRSNNAEELQPAVERVQGIGGQHAFGEDPLIGASQQDMADLFSIGPLQDWSLDLTTMDELWGADMLLTPSTRRDEWL